MSLIAVEWTSGLNLVLLVAGAIVTIGAAAAVILGLLRWLRPAKPLIAFGHPSETPTPFMFFVGGSPADDDRQDREYERLRLKYLGVSYLVENKGTTNEDAVRDLSTGLRSHGDGDGSQELTFDSCFAQILGPGEKVEIENETIPADFHQGMTEENRAENFVYWARFRDNKNRRWEATYEPKTRRLAYRRL